MKNYSLTYVAVIVLTALCTYLDIKVSQEEIQTFVVVVVAIGAGLVALYGRYRAGGLTALGFRTTI